MSRTLIRAAELAAELDGVILAGGWAPYAAAELWPVRLTGRGRYVVLGGPGGNLTAIPLWQWRAVLAGRRRVLWRERSSGAVRILALNDARKRWIPLYTFDPRRASIDAAILTALRRYRLT